VLRGMQPAPEQRPVARPAEEAALEAEQQGRDLDGQALQELEPAQPGRDPAGLELQRPEWAPPPLVRSCRQAWSQSDLVARCLQLLH
jgi:hypothetical protein